jgi:ABC-type glycerol-3-phosphate transport system substrate-binding protein
MQRSKLLVLGGMVLGAAATAFYFNTPSSTALAQPAQPSVRRTRWHEGITLDQAAAVMKAAAEKAKEINTKMDIAIVDAGGNLKGSPAWTARGSGRSTSRSRRPRPPATST